MPKPKRKECTELQKKYAKLICGIPHEEKIEKKKSFAEEEDITIRALNKWEFELCFINYLEEVEVEEKKKKIIGGDFEELLDKLLGLAYGREQEGDIRAVIEALKYLSKRKEQEEEEGAPKIVMVWSDPTEDLYSGYFDIFEKYEADIAIRERKIEEAEWFIKLREEQGRDPKKITYERGVVKKLQEQVRKLKKAQEEFKEEKVEEEEEKQEVQQQG